eukprot:CAMPEP_0113297004 /NCGR_PEP_ID=MMETSP0010_2-20120614/49_1 /TAXON_ID=216773 ORGANISM="Corethron hystrix, Strain 308" /NCGR_SAMPLE_ID=MMETSP0010_2 /ASSEMBLY_ACC=CAM_ASM_000155 /LENGTH=232 /DNA_ID=CAMNT_0000149825 /DNA_START=281 /DNA_END=978 /DNA_ORIENTATION=- /assembly_acc=CAM_ASM_000155
MSWTGDGDDPSPSDTPPVTSFTSDKIYECDDMHKYPNVGDIIGGLQGGKYVFGKSSPKGLLTPERAWFAKSLYSSSCANEEGDQNETWPRWAQQMELPLLGEKDRGKILVMSTTAEGAASTITVSNTESTWERFYAKIVRFSDNEEVENLKLCPFDVRPITGFLAPRGGANNACDENKPYSDSITLEVYWNRDAFMDSVNIDVADQKEVLKGFWLVVGTEEEKWYFELIIPS